MKFLRIVDASGFAQDRLAARDNSPLGRHLLRYGSSQIPRGVRGAVDTTTTAGCQKL